MKLLVLFVTLLLATAALAQSMPKTQAPLAPQTPQALQVGQHWVGLWWTMTGCPPCTGITFNVYKGTATGVCTYVNGIPPTPFATVSTLPTQTAPYVDTAVTAGTTYFYAVSALQNGGESTCTAEVQTLVPTSPATPNSLQGSTH